MQKWLGRFLPWGVINLKCITAAICNIIFCIVQQVCRGTLPLLCPAVTSQRCTWPYLSIYYLYFLHCAHTATSRKFTLGTGLLHLVLSGGERLPHHSKPAGMLWERKSTTFCDIREMGCINSVQDLTVTSGIKPTVCVFTGNKYCRLVRYTMHIVSLFRIFWTPCTRPCC